MSYRVSYHELVVKEDIPKLGAGIKARIRHAIESRLMTHPELYGKPLRRSLHGYYKLRAGDYRVIFKISASTIKILIIGHRSRVYEKIGQRL